jgi:hypothetical protein
MNMMWLPAPAVPIKTLFPTMGSTNDVVDLAHSQMPERYRNQVVALLGTYHNTLLSQITRTIQ